MKHVYSPMISDKQHSIGTAGQSGGPDPFLRIFFYRALSPFLYSFYPSEYLTIIKQPMPSIKTVIKLRFPVDKPKNL